jgi:hypothetical protein
MSLFDCGRRGFRESDVTDFTFTNKIGERTNGLFDGRVGIDAVLIVEVNHFDAVGFPRWPS